MPHAPAPQMSKCFFGHPALVLPKSVTRMKDDESMNPGRDTRTACNELSMLSLESESFHLIAKNFKKKQSPSQLENLLVLNEARL